MCAPSATSARLSTYRWAFLWTLGDGFQTLPRRSNLLLTREDMTLPTQADEVEEPETTFRAARIPLRRPRRWRPPAGVSSCSRASKESTSRSPSLAGIDEVFALPWRSRINNGLHPVVDGVRDSPVDRGDRYDLKQAHIPIRPLRIAARSHHPGRG